MVGAECVNTASGVSLRCYISMPLFPDQRLIAIARDGRETAAISIGEEDLPSVLRLFETDPAWYKSGPREFQDSSGYGVRVSVCGEARDQLCVTLLDGGEELDSVPFLPAQMKTVRQMFLAVKEP
jgi:hypothetical protein